MNWNNEGYKSLRAEIKRLKGVLTDAQFKSAFGNYTQLSTQALAKLVGDYHSSNVPTKKVAPKKAIVKEDKPLIDIPSLAPTPSTITLDLPISFIPAGIYVKSLTEDEIQSLSKILFK